MFYVKEKLNENTEIIIELNDENVFCHCPECDTEFSVDLSEIFADGADFYGTEVFCGECSKKRQFVKDKIYFHHEMQQ